MKDKSKINHYKSEANEAKHRLMNIADDLRSCEAFKEAEQLDKIIIKLEVWQNK